MDIERLVALSEQNIRVWLSRATGRPLIAPHTVQVNFTFDCNLTCKMCGMDEQKRFLRERGKQLEIDSETIRKVIRESKELGARMVLFLGGEPFLRSDLFDLLRYAKEHDLLTGVVTNGTLLDEETRLKCVEGGLDCLSVSIDGASEEVVGGIRGSGVLGTIIENIEALNRLKKEKGKQVPSIISVCTIMDDNLEELPAVAALSRKLGMDRAIFQPVVVDNTDQTLRDREGSKSIPPARLKVLDQGIDSLLRYKTSSRENFDFISNSVEHLRLIKRYFRGQVTPRELPCYAGFTRVQVVQTGKMYFCVNQNEHEAVFGDIKEQTLKEMWFSKEASAYRELIRDCKAPCLQYCSLRVDDGEWTGMWRKAFLPRSVTTGGASK